MSISSITELTSALIEEASRVDDVNENGGDGGQDAKRQQLVHFDDVVGAATFPNRMCRVEGEAAAFICLTLRNYAVGRVKKTSRRFTHPKAL